MQEHVRAEASVTGRYSLNPPSEGCIGAPKTNRTSDPALRRGLLYPLCAGAFSFACRTVTSEMSPSLTSLPVTQLLLLGLNLDARGPPTLFRFLKANFSLHGLLLAGWNVDTSPRLARPTRELFPFPNGYSIWSTQPVAALGKAELCVKFNGIAGGGLR